MNKSDQMRTGERRMPESSLTGLQLPAAFMESAGNFIKRIEPDTYCFVAIDIIYFRMINKICGRSGGDKLLRRIADCLEKFRMLYDGVTGYFEGDDFCIIMPWKMELVKQLMKDIRREIEALGVTIGVIPFFGVSVINDTGLPPEVYCDRATLALSKATGRCRISMYDPKMENQLEEDMNLLAEIIKGIEQNEFVFYVQPQCDISTGRIVGAESLVRWQSKKNGLVMPGRFIPLLERIGMIYILDRQIWEKVCQWLRSWIDRGYRPVPISVNISRMDVISMDVPDYLSKLLKKYDLSPKYLKAEITESACMEEDSLITQTVDRLKELGFLVMMDDFGSGYSSLNMLKSIAVDVLKIDMQFLKMAEAEEQRGVSILESIINMARLMGLPIIAEGVETVKQENILRSMGCRYTQGYYYYKPLPIEQFEEMLADERQLDFGGLSYQQIENFHIREFLDGNLFTDTMINNIMGAAAIYDVYKNQIEITRVNEEYYRMSGMEVLEGQVSKMKLWNSVRDDDRPVLISLFEQAYEKYPVGAEGYIHYLRVDGKILWVNIKVFFLREKEGHRLFFISLEDMTLMEEKREEWMQRERPSMDHGNREQVWLDRCYGSLPFGFGLFKIASEQIKNIDDYELIYTNREMKKLCGGDQRRLRHLLRKGFEEDMSLLQQRAYQAAFLGDSFTYYGYSSISSHYFQFTFCQYSYGCFACLLQDVTHMQVQKRALNSLVNAYREVYYLQLNDNYCRKIYPEDVLNIDRGNYEGMVERHFGTGRILKYDMENVRRFLSLENLCSVLTEEDSVYYRYRRSTEESPDEWCLVNVMVSERKDGKPVTAVMTVQSIDKQIKREEEQRQKRIADTLASMSDGFFVYQAMGDERILYANPALMDIFGCESMEELMELVGYSFRGIVHPEDLNRVEWEIEHQIQNSDQNLDYVQYRIIRKDGQILWVDDYGHLENSKWGEEHRLFYVFVKDITDSITSVQKDKLLKANQFYN